MSVLSLWYSWRSPHLTRSDDSFNLVAIGKKRKTHTQTVEWNLWKLVAGGPEPRFLSGAVNPPTVGQVNVTAGTNKHHLHRWPRLSFWFWAFFGSRSLCCNSERSSTDWSLCCFVSLSQTWIILFFFSNSIYLTHNSTPIYVVPAAHLTSFHATAQS